jgi:hypothetical protein
LKSHRYNELCVQITYGLLLLVSVGYLTHELTTPETHGTTLGADGNDFLYDWGYLSLKFSRGSAAWIHKYQKLLYRYTEKRRTDESH